MNNFGIISNIFDGLLGKLRPVSAVILVSIAGLSVLPANVTQSDATKTTTQTPPADKAMPNLQGDEAAQGKTGLVPESSTFSNPSPITINDSVSPPTAATPYPSNIAVAGLAGVVTKVTVTLTNISHTFPDDIEVLLVGPTGQKALLMSDVGAGTDISGVNLTFDDAAAASIPDSGPIVSGTFKPTDFAAGDTFPAPAPVGPYIASLVMFNNTAPNGMWQLFVVDDASQDSGSIAGGWSLTIDVGPVVVINTNDSGAGSLRQAILDANANPGMDSITFNIPGPGVKTIVPLSGLPIITSPVIIDGYTQPGSSVNTLAGGNNAILLIELNGANLASGGVPGLRITAGGSIVRGLVINRFKRFHSGDDGDGIKLETSGGNVIEGNFIGTSASGDVDLGNEGDGVDLTSAPNNVIGGIQPAARNIISGNSGAGIHLVGGLASANAVQGNFIGTNRAGLAALANNTGVFIEGAPNNTIGGNTAGASNMISGNFEAGVKFISFGASGNTVAGNFIGTNLAGTVALPNASSGILFNGSSNNNIIGGTAAGARNVISGNGGNGISIAGDGGSGNPFQNVVQGNLIGTDVTGNLDLGNAAHGVIIIETGNNTIGGATPATRNVISGNGGEGISLQGDGNLVQGNYIGTSITGASSLGNAFRGVLIKGDDNIISNVNIISGNLVGLSVQAGIGNTISGNRIGTNADGTAGLGNLFSGVVLQGDANTLGGASSGERNIISANTTDGVQITGNGNVVLGNFIGTDWTGTVDLGNSANGVFVSIGNNNTIGGTTAASSNLISGNNGDGVLITTSADNRVQRNLIGTTVNGTNPLGNGGNGVAMESEQASNNTVGGSIPNANTIAFNGANGVSVDAGNGNALLSNRIHSNTGLAINLGPAGVTPNDPGDADSGANMLQNFPVLTSATTASGVTVQGTLNSTGNSSFLLEFFSNTVCSSSGNGEAISFLGSIVVMTGGGGIANFSASFASSVPVGQLITATATDFDNNTSEFSGCVQVMKPTEVEFTGSRATKYDGGVLIEWQTGFEANNLGFRVYREESGNRVLLNQQVLAGSALMAGSVALGAGRSYSWWDKGIADCGLRIADCQNAQYWLEDIDLNGQSTWHGPVYMTQIGEKPPAHSQAESLSQVGQTNYVDATHPVESFAALAKLVQPGSLPVSSPASLQQASLASSRAVKIGVRQAGWYRVSQAELINAGLDPKTDPRTLRLFVDGIELPMFVAGEEDGSFDANDALEFYGLGLNTPSTDTRVYWLVSGAQAGLRINKVPFAKGYPSGESFAHTVGRRDRTIYFSALRNGDEENFFGAVVSGSALEQRVTVNSLALSARETAIIEVSLQGVTTLPHQVSVSLNGSSIGRLVFNGQANAHEKIEVSQAILREGDNVITLGSLNGPSDISLVDFIRITYQHSYRAENDGLSFTARSGETATINGFSSKDVRVLDVTDERDVQELAVSIDQTKDGYAASVTVLGAGDRKLLALTEGRALRAENIKANEPSSLRQSSNAADFVIISQASLAGSLKPLVDLRSRQGLITTLVDIEDIYDEFTFGNKSPQSVKDFLSYAAKSWKVKPRFVLFAADASYDARNYLGLGDNDLVPTKLIDTTYLETASDDWFVDFNDDGIADLTVGRLPIRTAGEASAVINKLIAYEQSAPSNEVALVADSNDGFDFEQASTSLRSLIPSSIRATEIFRSRSDDLTARSQVLTAINRGQKIVNYTGHGSVNVWRGNLLTASDGHLLTNSNRLSLFVMMTCLNGYFQDAMNESLGESLLKAETGGAVAVWASSALCLPEQQAVMNQELYRLLFGPSSRALTLGEMMRQAKGVVSDADIRRSWILLGDPTMRVK